MTAVRGAARVGALLLSCGGALVSSAGAAVAQVTPHTVWTAEARSSMPMWVQLWIPFMFLAFGAGLSFVRRHPQAWWIVGAFLASHLASGLERWLLGAERLTVGMIAISHCVFSAPAAVLLFVTTREVPAKAPFRIWRGVILATVAISLAFDFRDAWIVLQPPGLGLPRRA